VKRARWAPALLALAGLASPAAAVDLTKVERRVGKEPAYATKAPRYCLLVFGPEAKARVWLVLDGDVLYVDRNGNGDLTEKGERVELPRFDESKDGNGHGTRQARVGKLPAAGPRDAELMLMQMRLGKDIKPENDEDVRMAKLFAELPDRIATAVILLRPGAKEQGGMPPPSLAALQDHAGLLCFAPRAVDAPIIHVGGPLQLTLPLQRFQQLIRGQENELRTHVGTPGLGKGTFVTIMYDGVIPADVHPVAEIEFPPAGPGKEPVRVKTTLSKRC
jgi:hypothetical protein